MTPAQRKRHLSGPFLRLTSWRPYVLAAAVLAAVAAGCVATGWLP